MGCCHNKPEQKAETEQKAGGCCGGAGRDHHGHGHDHGAMKSEGGACCKGGAIFKFIKKLFGAKKSGCCN